DQVDEDLAEAAGIAFNYLGNFGRDFIQKFQSLFVGAQRERLQGGFQAIAQTEIDRFRVDSVADTLPSRAARGLELRKCG
ncbi:MAG TPA: hypothetical protein VNO32_64850, partial [Candidatus Acidoferrum sp.]|nr:hypothetical protein [Candidatus Acidoferrum sp.]